MNHDQHCQHKGFLKWFLTWQGVFVTLALAALSFYLLTEHREHIALALPYLFLLACPLSHLLGGHHHVSSEKDKRERTNSL